MPPRFSRKRKISSRKRRGHGRTRRPGRRLPGLKRTRKHKLGRGFRHGARRQRRRIGGATRDVEQTGAIRGNGKTFKSKVIQALASQRTFKYEYNQTENVVATPGTYQTCNYFTTEVDDIKGIDVDTALTPRLGDLGQLAEIADFCWPVVPATGSIQGGVFGGAATQDLKGQIELSGSCKYNVRSMTNEDVYLTAYYCKVRKDGVFLVNSAAAADEKRNIYHYLSLGFAQNGLNPTQTAPSLNAYMKDKLGSPFQSWKFIQNFKIHKIKKFKLSPGKETSLKINLKRMLWRPSDYIVIPARFAGSTAGTWGSNFKSTELCKFQRFILFKLDSRIAHPETPATPNLGALTNTTPTVIMSTHFTYRTRFVATEQSPDVIFTSINFQSTSNAQIMRDEDFKAGTEVDA